MSTIKQFDYSCYGSSDHSSISDMGAHFPANAEMESWEYFCNVEAEND